MLEGIVQALSGELEDKRRLLRELTASGGGGGSAVPDAAVSAAGDSVPVLKSLLQKSMGENERLKRDLRTLGAETLAAQDKARAAVAEGEAREAEVAALKRALGAAEEAAAAAAAGGGEGGEGEERGGEEGAEEEAEAEAGGGGEGRLSPGNPFAAAPPPSSNPF